MLYRPSSFRKSAFALTTVAALSASSFFPAYAQNVSAAVQPIINTAVGPAVPVGECGAFGKYLLDEARDFKQAMSKTFLTGAGRFLKAGCKPHDDQGEIQIITMTDQDGISLLTALRLMGRFDIFTASGVKHCHRPEMGSCPAPVGASNARPSAGG